MNNEVTLHLPIKIITYAWGEKYVDELLAITVPAALASGNLPYIASQEDCELIILTEERLFSRIAEHPAVLKAKTFCPIRLVGLDDLITLKDKYGMALTYALHRGFADLGASMVDHWLIFLNADFVMADGSLRSLLHRLQRGERIVASPSYCVVSEAVLPTLMERLDPDTGALELHPREMAKLALENLHNTIRAKTLSDTTVGFRHMDQFYWEADENTLVGRQMPVAIVGMRPERYIAEPNSYWDYGLMKEFCPTEEFHIIGDSDEFLMIELRSESTAKDQVLSDQATPRVAAAGMMSFLTEYQRDFARHRLVLHSDELPSTVDAGHQELQNFIDNTFEYLPKQLPSHIDHAQWDYHYPPFIVARHSYLSLRLGSATALSEPPETLSNVDKVWWQYDGLKKRYELGTKELEAERDHTIALVGAVAESARQDELDKLDRKLKHELRSDALDFLARNKLYANISAAEIVDDRGLDPDIQRGLSKYWSELAEWRACSQHNQVKMRAALLEVEEYYARSLWSIETSLKPRLFELESRYNKMVAPRLVSAETAYVEIFDSAHIKRTPPEPRRLRSIRAAYQRYFLNRGLPSKFSPYFSVYFHISSALLALSSKPDAICLIVASPDSMLAARVKATVKNTITIQFEHVVAAGSAKMLQTVPTCDICVCEIPPNQSKAFSIVLKGIRPKLQQGGTIFGFYINPDFNRPLEAGDFFNQNEARRLSAKSTVVFSGSNWSNYAIKILRRAVDKFAGSNLVRLVALGSVIIALQPFVLLANAVERKKSRQAWTTSKTPCTAATIEIELK